MTSRPVNVYEAKTTLSKLLDRAAAGEEIVIARAGRPVARRRAVRLLLDTHALLWWLADRGLAKPAREAIADSGNDVLVSSASAWEISIKKTIGTLSAPDDLGEQISANGFEELPIRVDHALLAGALPRHHDDPFDRMLLAQAARESLTIVTRDERFAAYNLTIIAA